MARGANPRRTCQPTLGLVLTGGGARAAYQVGVLQALARMFPRSRNPFGVISGTSAGAVSACVLASQAYRWRRAVVELAEVWAGFRVDQVFMTSPLHTLRAGAHWVLALLSGGLLLRPPGSVLDNSPLRELLTQHIRWEGVRASIERGHLRGVAISATCYRTGQSIAFYDAATDIRDWTRSQHLGVRTPLQLDHLMASVALPMLFPPMQLGDGWYGDGSMRQLNPLSPAIHLGAERLLIVGVGMRGQTGITTGVSGMPGAGQILGFMLDTLFTDQIQADMEQTRRLNELIEWAPESPEGRDKDVSRVETLMITPSVDPREIAARHVAAMPRAMRALLRVIGARGAGASQLVSYLMFEGAYTRALMDLGYRDAQRLEGPLRDFIGGEPETD